MQCQLGIGRNEECEGYICGCSAGMLDDEVLLLWVLGCHRSVYIGDGMRVDWHCCSLAKSESDRN